MTVTVSGVNDEPTAIDDTYKIDEDTTNNSLDVLANDTDAPDAGETLTITVVGMLDQGGTATTDGSTSPTRRPRTSSASRPSPTRSPTATAARTPPR